LASQSQIPDANLPEVHPERIDPEVVQALRIASGDVSGNAFVEPEAREEPKGGGQSLLAMPTFLLKGCSPSQLGSGGS